MTALDDRLLAAHARDDRAALIGLYTEAADWAEGEDRIAAACFYLTQAYVFALERGADTTALRHRLIAHGRL